MTKAEMSAEPVQTVAEAIGPSDGSGAATVAVDRLGDAAVKWFNPNTFAFKYFLSSCAATVAETGIIFLLIVGKTNVSSGRQTVKQKSCNCVESDQLDSELQTFT